MNPKTRGHQHECHAELPINKSPKKENVVSGKQTPAGQRGVLTICLTHEEPGSQGHADRAQAKYYASARDETAELLQAHQQYVHGEVRIRTKRNCVVLRELIIRIVDMSQDEDAGEMIWIVKQGRIFDDPKRQD